MKFAKIVFNIAGAWGVIALLPLYFLFDRIGIDDPPPITHPGFYYGFAGIGLAWQLAFFLIARDPIRYRPMMIPGLLEKLAFGGAVVVLVAQNRTHANDLVFGGIDLLFCVLFAVAFARTPSR
jgi:hypothetical protein